MTEQKKNTPEKKFKIGGVTTTLWKNQSSKGEFYTMTTTRSYKDQNGTWQTSETLRANDVPKAILSLQQAYEYIYTQTKTTDD